MPIGRPEPPSEVMDRLRSWIEEARLGGVPLPDRDTWLRRYPGHADGVRKLFDEIPAETATDAEAEGPPPAAGEPPPADETPEPGAPRLLRTDAHGSLFATPDGARVYRIPAERLAERNPAAFYLRRVRRVASAGVTGVQAATITEVPGGDVEVRWRPVRGLPLRLGGILPRSGRAWGTIRRLAQAAATLARLHEAGAAHGRLRPQSFRITRRPRQLVIAMDYESGPGRDGSDIARDQAADVRALGAFLYGALSGEDGARNLGEIQARSATGELPPLRARRPRLLPHLATAVERALHAGTGSPESGSMADLSSALDRALDFETTAAPLASRDPLRRPFLITAAVLLLAATAVAMVSAFSPSNRSGGARLALQPESDTRLVHIRSLALSGKETEARHALDALGRELGLPPAPDADPETDRQPPADGRAIPGSGGETR